MGTSRNPGMLAVIAGVALAVLFGLLGLTTVLPGQTAFALAIVSLVLAALLYVFYSRGNVIEKTGYGALLLIIATAFILPLLLINQQQAQATQTSSQYTLTLQRGAALFGQQCARCHGYQGQGIIGPRLNNSPALAKLKDDDIRRIISAGVPQSLDPNTLDKLQMPAWSQAYGGPLTEDDISYLLSLIRSSDKAYLQTNNLPVNENGFSFVLASLTNPTQIADYNSQLKSGSKPPDSSFADLTSQSTITIDAQDVSGFAVPWDWVTVGAKDASGNPTNNIKVKAGTKIVWGNKSTAPHNVVSGANGQSNGKFKDSPGILGANSSDTYSITLTTPGDYPYYCGIHPPMVGYITVVP